MGAILPTGPMAGGAKATPSAPEFPLATRMLLTLYALVLFAVLAYARMDESPTSLIFVSVAGALSWILVDSKSRRAGGGEGIPKWILNLIVLLAAMYLFYEVIIDQVGRNLILSLSHFILALLMCKLFEKKRQRDVVQIIVLSLLIAVSSTMFSTSGLLFSLILAAYCAILCYAVMLVNLGFEVEGLAPAAAARGRGGGGAERVVVMPENGLLGTLLRDVRLSAKQCALLMMPVALVLFLSMPRTRTAALSSPWGLNGTFQSGFTDTVQFRDFGTMTQSDEVVMKVTLTRAGEKVSANYNDLYFRGEVLDEYSDKKSVWFRGPVMQRTLIAGFAPDPQGGDEADPQPAYTPLAVTREASTQPQAEITASTQPTTGTQPDGMDAPEEHLEQVSVHYELFVRSGPTLFVLAPVAAPVPSRYLAQYMTLTSEYQRQPRYSYSQEWWPGGRNAGVGASPYIEPGLLRDRGVGRDSTGLEKVKVSTPISDLARKLAKDFLPASGEEHMAPENIRSVVTIFENYLKTTYKYSLTFRQVDPKLDPTTDFLLHRQESGGHCEYFASAMVMLCRAVGLNARMVVGYHGGEYNPIDDSIIVRQRDAHAWAEVYMPEDGWVTSDPSPMERASDANANGFARWMHDVSSLIQNAWLTSVVAFDNDTRDAIMAWVTVRVGQAAEAIAGHMWFTVLLGVCVIGALAALGRALAVWHRHFVIRRSVNAAALHRAGRLSGQLLFLEQLLAMFGKTSGARRADQTPLEYLMPAAGESRVREDVRWLVETAYGIRFGGVEVDAGLKERIVAVMKRVRAGM